ncbi:MAG: YeeE/YedE family protein [Alphaproteobacteria bacterium]|nr:YeeE/YedE family protein [Alphaproteobacteria bacterium]
MLKLNTEAWSPYVAGVIIGLLQIPAFLVVDTALGTSSSYVKVGGHLAMLFDPAVGETGYFAKYITDAKYIWQLALVIGVTIGAFVSARLSNLERIGMSRVWWRAVGLRSLRLRMVMGFFGGFVMLFGARLAGGCTSGHGVSGLAQLAVGSTIAIAAMFLGGILMTMMFRRI